MWLWTSESFPVRNMLPSFRDYYYSGEERTDIALHHTVQRRSPEQTNDLTVFYCCFCVSVWVHWETHTKKDQIPCIRSRILPIKPIVRMKRQPILKPCNTEDVYNHRSFKVYSKDLCHQYNNRPHVITICPPVPELWRLIMARQVILQNMMMLPWSWLGYKMSTLHHLILFNIHVLS